MVLHFEILTISAQISGVSLKCQKKKKKKMKKKKKKKKINLSSIYCQKNFFKLLKFSVC